MKKVEKDKIINIDNNKFDRKFLFEYLEINFKSNKKVEIEFNCKKYSGYQFGDIKIFYISELLKECKNTDLFKNLNGKFAMYSEVFSPKDEFQIFEDLFNFALEKKEKIHIIGITLKEELELLENYYKKEGFLREDVNCFIPDFFKILISVSVNIENLIWRGSDYKAQKKEIFFIPPIRESGQNKAMFKGINRGSITSIYIKKFGDYEKNFLKNCIINEKILSITLAKVLNYNLAEIGFEGEKKELVISY